MSFFLGGRCLVFFFPQCCQRSRKKLRVLAIGWHFFGMDLSIRNMNIWRHLPFWQINQSPAQFFLDLARKRKSSLGDEEVGGLHKLHIFQVVVCGIFIFLFNPLVAEDEAILRHFFNWVVVFEPLPRGVWKLKERMFSQHRKNGFRFRKSWPSFRMFDAVAFLIAPYCYCWWFRYLVNSPLEVGSLSHYLQVFL